MTTYKERHSYYHARFCDLYFIAVKKSVTKCLVTDLDRKLTENIFSEMMDDTTIVLTSYALACIHHLGDYFEINEFELFKMIDKVLGGIRLAAPLQLEIDFDVEEAIEAYGGADITLALEE